MKKIDYLPLCLSLLLFLPSLSSANSKDARDLVYDIRSEGTQMKLDEDHDDVYEAVQKGLIKPFSELYQTVEQQLNGRLIKVELDEDDDIWIYELKLLHNNNVIKAEYDAMTLELTELRGRHLMSVIKR